MKRQYLHLSAYQCDKCEGPVISGSIKVRENEISKETDVREIGAMCLACGHKQAKAGEASIPRQCPPMEWQPIKTLCL
jgi:RNase P subunit RPR2